MTDHNRPSRSERSRSPYEHDHHVQSHRKRSPHHKRKRSPPATTALTLPYNVRPLSKHDYQNLKPMFALYLDIQKGKVLEDMETLEAKGRWKSFVGKWNRAELSEGWYDPETFARAVRANAEEAGNGRREERKELGESGNMEKAPSISREHEGDGESDDDFGPALPGREGSGRSGRMGPSIPSMGDLELKREMDLEDTLAQRDDIRFARQVDRRAQKAALDELLPRAEAGTRERQLEKKKEVNEKMRSFRERSPGAAEVPDGELMGDGEGVAGYKRQKQEVERKKNEREIRKEEMLRARQAEREERLQEYRVKEEGTMAMLKALAKQRFG